MRFHSEYNIALRLSGLLFQVLLFTTPPVTVLILLISYYSPGWPLFFWLEPLLDWSLILGAIATLLLLLGSLWDAR